MEYNTLNTDIMRYYLVPNSTALTLFAQRQKGSTL